MPSNFEQLVFEIIATDRNASAAFDRFRQKVDQTSRSVDESSKTIDRSQGSLDRLGKTAEKAAGTGGTSGLSALIGGAGLQGGGMAALIAAGVALSPVIATVGTGLLGFGAAAVGVAKPILAASQATGGLAANLAKLNPEQQQVAQGILNLGKQFGTFEKQLQPAVLGVFNQGLSIAGHLLRDVAPVAKATGTALGGLLGRIDAEFQSGTWQKFFGFMAAQAGPDVQLLGDLFVNLTTALPPLLTALQPLAVELLKDSAGTAQLINQVANLALGLEHLGTASLHAGTASQRAGGFLGFLAHSAKDVLGELVPAIPGLARIQQELHKLGDNAGTAGTGLKGTGAAAAGAKPAVFSLNTAVASLNTSMTTLVGNLLTLQGSNLAWKQSMQAATAQLRSNSAGLEGNSRNALANKQAVLSSTQAALQFAQQELTTGKNISGASDTVQAQIRFLQGLRDKSAFVRSELSALRAEEKLLQAQRMDQQLSVHGTGSWSIAHGGGPQGMGVGRAAGGLIGGGVPGKDSVPILAMPGELVVPTHMVAAGLVDHLRGALPGFASGGIVPSYSGNVGGLKPWLIGNDNATIRLIDLAVVQATLAGIKAAQAAAASIGGHAGPGGGAPSANAALAHRLYASQLTPASWAAWNFVAMAESGWNQFARNPSSGAYGIAQALPPTKYPFAGQAAGGSNPTAQITWMWDYMMSRYGGPLGAQAHEAAFRWYDYGGWLPPGASVAVNQTGQPERVTSPGQETAMLAALGRIERLLAAAPARTGDAVGGALTGASRAAARAGRYSTRGA